MASTSSHFVLLAELPNRSSSLDLSYDTILNLAKFLPKSSEIDDEDFPYYVAVDPACIFCRITDAKLCIAKKTGCCWRCSNEGLRCTRVSWLSQGGESSKQAQNGSALEPSKSPSGFCGNPGKREPGDTCTEVTQLDAKEGTLSTSVGQTKISLVPSIRKKKKKTTEDCVPLACYARLRELFVGSLVCSWLASEAEESSFVTLTEKKSAFALSIQELKDRATKLRTKPKNLLQSLAKLDEELKNWRVELASPIKSNPTLRKMQITSVLTAIAVKPEGFESAMRDTLKQGLKGNVKSLSFEGIADVWFEVARTLLQHPGAL